MSGKAYVPSPISARSPFLRSQFSRMRICAFVLAACLMGVALADGSLVGPRRHLSAVLAPETAPKGAAAPGLVPGPEVEMELASVPAPQPVLAPAPFAVLPPSISSPANPPPPSPNWVHVTSTWVASRRVELLAGPIGNDVEGFVP